MRVISPPLDVLRSFLLFPLVALIRRGQSLGIDVEDGCASRSGKGSVASFDPFVGDSDVYNKGFWVRNTEPLVFEVVLVMRSLS